MSQIEHTYACPKCGFKIYLRDLTKLVAAYLGRKGGRTKGATKARDVTHANIVRWTGHKAKGPYVRKINALDQAPKSS
jgi:hypothetical protein